MTPLLEVENLSKHFPIRKGIFSRVVGAVKAVEQISFSIARGEIVGLVGESGSGKTTLGRTLLRLIEPTTGSIRFDGIDLCDLDAGDMQAMRRRVQFIFQDPFSSLNPRMSVGAIVGEALDIHRLSQGSARRDRIVELLELVGLPADSLSRAPHQFSGGQRQRVGIARALAVSPEFIVADEPVSALDVLIQAQVINLLQDLQERLGLTLLMIAHDLAVVEHIADRTIVMYLGRIMEIAPGRTLYRTPRHPYTEALLSAAPIPDPLRRRERIILTGDPPSPMQPIEGCVFRTRCRYAQPECAASIPPLTEVSPGHFKACVRDDILN